MLLARFAVIGCLLLPAELHGATAEGAAACTGAGSLKPIMRTHTVVPYPKQSVIEHEQGATILTVQVGSDGMPAEVIVTRPSGFQRLDDTAVSYVQTHWRWEPPAEDCKPTAANATVTIGWYLGMPPKAQSGINVRPSFYPLGAAERGEMGDTYLELSLDDAGTAKEARIVYSSGFADLDDKALEIAKSSPGIMAGKPAGIAILLMRWSLPPEKQNGIEFVVSRAQVVRN